MDDPPLTVEVAAGYKGEPTPRAFVHEGLRREVTHVVETWYTEAHCYFRVIADDGGRYVVRHEFDKNLWELVMQER